MCERFYVRGTLEIFDVSVTGPGIDNNLVGADPQLSSAFINVAVCQRNRPTLGIPSFLMLKFINRPEQAREHVEQYHGIPGLKSISVTKITSPIKNIEPVKTTCEPTFDVPGLAMCLQVSKELESLSGDLVLIPKKGPLFETLITT